MRAVLGKLTVGILFYFWIINPLLAQSRFALVIGNEGYSPEIGTLTNPHNDVALVANALTKVGFSVVSRVNLSRADIAREVHNYAIRLSNAGPGAIGFFYYSGHGVSNATDHVNYLIPIDVSNLQDQNLWWNAVSLDQMLDELENVAPNASHIVVFDACRNGLRLPTKSVVKGFEPVTRTRGMFIAFSTSPNASSSDAGDGGGPYARILANEIVRPGQDQLSLFQNVKDRVYEATSQTQRPWENSDLIGHIYLAGAPAPLPQSSLEDQAKLIWDAFGQQTSDARFLGDFIARYGETQYAGLARQRLVEIGQPVPSKPAPVKPAPASAPQTLTALKNDVVAACRPNTDQTARNIGGQFVGVTLKPILASAKELRTIAISPNGKQIAAAGDDRIIRLWDATNLRFIREVRGHTAPVYAVAFSADGALLASASLDGTVRIWDAQTFAPVRTFTANNGSALVLQYDVAFEPIVNPHYVASAGADGNVWIWNLTTGNLATRKGNGISDVRSLSFAPGSSGSFVTASFDGMIRFFGTSGKVTTVAASSGKILHVVYSPSGKLVASAGVDSANEDVKLWNVSNYELSRALQAHRGHANSLAWSRDSTRLATGGGFLDHSVRLWDVQSGKQLQVFSGHDADVESVIFHPNQKWMVSASEDKTMKIWDIASGKELLSVVGFSDGEYLAYAPNGCYTGSANAANYVKYVTKDAQGHEHDTGDNGRNTMFVPGDSTAVLLPQ
jgi:WD40 repeat protein